MYIINMNKKKQILIIFITILTMLPTGCRVKKEDTITVAIPPLQCFAEKIVQDKINITVAIPYGNSPANYQPTAKTMLEISNSDLYFTLQMPAERANILPNIANFNKDIKVIDLQENVRKTTPLITRKKHSHSKDNSKKDTKEDIILVTDPHIWLSPKIAIKIVQKMTETLIDEYPENRVFFLENSKAYQTQLKELDAKIQKETSKIKNRKFLIYHGSYSYFARDYNLEMIAIEKTGKKATAKDIKKLIKTAKKNRIKYIFYQKEFDTSQANLIAEEIQGSAVQVDPLSVNYIESFTTIIKKLSGK